MNACPLPFWYSWTFCNSKPQTGAIGKRNDKRLSKYSHAHTLNLGISSDLTTAVAANSAALHLLELRLELLDLSMGLLEVLVESVAL